MLVLYIHDVLKGGSSSSSRRSKSKNNYLIINNIIGLINIKCGWGHIISPVRFTMIFFINHFFHGIQQIFLGFYHMFPLVFERITMQGFSLEQLIYIHQP